MCVCLKSIRFILFDFQESLKQKLDSCLRVLVDLTAMLECSPSVGELAAEADSSGGVSCITPLRGDDLPRLQQPTHCKAVATTLTQVKVCFEQLAHKQSFGNKESEL